MYLPSSSDPDGGWPGGDDGTFDSPARVVALGVLFPVVCLTLAGWCIVSGEVVVPSERGPALHLYGAFVVTAAVIGWIGVAAAFFGHWFWPNVFRRSTAGEPVSAIGLLMAVAGLIGVVVAGVR